jgi:hypothetical protein
LRSICRKCATFAASGRSRTTIEPVGTKITAAVRAITQRRRAITDIQQQVRHPTVRWMGATLDGRVDQLGRFSRQNSCGLSPFARSRHGSQGFSWQRETLSPALPTILAICRSARPYNPATAVDRSLTQAVTWSELSPWLRATRLPWSHKIRQATPRTLGSTSP